MQETAIGVLLSIKNPISVKP